MPLINVKTAFYLNEILFNPSINTKVSFMAFSKALNNKDIHLPTIAVTFNVKAPRNHIKVNFEMFRYQDSFLAAMYQTPQYVQNNQLLLPPPPHYSSHFMEESRICNPSQPCFMAKQSTAYSQSAAETFSSNVHGSQLPFNFGSDQRTLIPQTSSAKLNISGKLR